MGEVDDLKPFNLVCLRDCDALAKVKLYLRANKIQYEPSDYGCDQNNNPLVYLNIYTTPDQGESINRFLDSISDSSWNIQ
jgi:hypothetical protein